MSKAIRSASFKNCFSATVRFKAVNEAFNEVVNNNRGKKIAIFSHGYAITFFLMKWVKLLELTEDRKFTFEFNGKVFYNKKLDAPEIFKLTINENNELIDIEYIPFLNE